jgi:nucleotide-binding universal stress UspA family protein
VTSSHARAYACQLAGKLALERQADLDAIVARHRPLARFGRVIVEIGEPEQVIATCARDVGADLVVVGIHGRTGLSHAFLGSVADSVVRTAPCPVLTVRTQAA